MSWPREPISPAPVSGVDQVTKMAIWIDKQFSQPRGGRTEPIESMPHLWERILECGDEPTVLVVPTGERLRGYRSLQEADRMGRVDRKWTVAIVRGRGFQMLVPNPEGALYGGKEMLVASIEALRDCVRVLADISEEFPLHYEGWEPIPPIARPANANIFVAGALLNFSAANDLPEVSRTIGTVLTPGQ